jgi:IS605 OrfB family transposase
VNEQAQAVSATRTLRLKVRANAYAWLNAAAVEVNQVFNWANATSVDAADRNRRANAKFLSGFDLNNLSAGATECFERIGADTIQRVNCEYASKRRAAKKVKLRWRISRGARKSLGWVPFKAASLKRKGAGLRFCGKSFRVFDREYLGNHKFKDGCFAQDATGDWWLCVPVEMQIEQSVAPCEAVGIDLGLKTIATTSDGDTLDAGRWTRRHADRLALAQRRGHKKQAKRIHRKIARQRKDALHKFSTRTVRQYQSIYVGDVSSAKLVKTKMAKSVLDSGWSTLKGFLHYKSQRAGRHLEIVNERNTTRTCSSCGALTGPTGLDMLVVRQWICSECGDSHDRDVNAARNIRTVGLRCRASVRGNESSPSPVPPRAGCASAVARAGTEAVRVTA